MFRKSLSAFLTLAAISVLSALWTSPAAAADAATETWPVKPIRYVIPWPAGGSADLYGRVLARALSKVTGQPVVIDNKPGATGSIGAEAVARGVADGYTLLQANNVVIVGNTVQNQHLELKPMRDLTPVAVTLESQGVIFINGELGIRSFQAFLAKARASGEPFAFGSSGPGSISHLSVEQIGKHFGLNLLHVPYKGTGPLYSDLLAGHVQVGMVDYALAEPQIKNGRLQPLLVIGAQRLAALPNVPTTVELGVREPDFGGWTGIFVPPRTPPQRIQAISQALARAQAEPEVREFTAKPGNRPIFLGAVEARGRIERDVAAWERYVNGGQGGIIARNDKPEGAGSR
ncbi:tripartite tricarboxylate transporter substrate binding protein [Cupriavidus basilensis]